MMLIMQCGPREGTSANFAVIEVGSRKSSLGPSTPTFGGVLLRCNTGKLPEMLFVKVGPIRSFDGDLSPQCSFREPSIHMSRSTDAALRSAIGAKQSVDSHKPKAHSEEIESLYLTLSAHVDDVRLVRFP
jgi:hypothetical protein